MAGKGFVSLRSESSTNLAAIQLHPGAASMVASAFLSTKLPLPGLTKHLQVVVEREGSDGSPTPIPDELVINLQNFIE